MTNAIKGIIVAHWSEDGQVSPSHIRGEHSNAFIYNSIDELYEELIQTFTFQGSNILNLIGDTTSGNHMLTHIVGFTHNSMYQVLVVNTKMLLWQQGFHTGIPYYASCLLIKMISNAMSMTL